MLGLRTADGLPEEWLRVHCDPVLLDGLLAEGALVRIPCPAGREHLRIPEERFFVSDDIIRDLI